MYETPTEGSHGIANRGAARPTQSMDRKRYRIDTGIRIKLFAQGTVVLLAGLLLLKPSLWLCSQFTNLEIVGYLPLIALTIVWSSREYFVDALQGKKERPLVTVIGPVVSPVISPKEFLLRPSQRPPSQQRAELLRAAVHGQETPMGELLRAVQGTVTTGVSDQAVRETKSENIA